MTIGDIACKIESINESEIKCRTPAGAEEQKTYAETKLLTPFHKKVTNKFIRNKYSTEEVGTFEECQNRCLVDATCEAFFFEEGISEIAGCSIVDFVGNEKTGDAQIKWMTTDCDEKTETEDTECSGGNWVEHPSALGGYVEVENNVADQSKCYTSRGQLYSGTLATTKSGNACKRLMHRTI